jgi:alpha-tubulin suppressor-like RCC1 family protein
MANFIMWMTRLAPRRVGSIARFHNKAFMKAMYWWTLRILISSSFLGLVAARATPAPVTVVAWGDTTFGQTTVPPGSSNLVAVAAGFYGNLALRSDGTVIGWGSTKAAANIPPALTNVIALAVGGRHSLALRSNGTVIAWGDNSLGQTNVPAGLTSVAAIAAGTNHSLVLRSNHTAIAWGRNVSGQTNVPSGLNNAVAIACGDAHCLALRSNGTVLAWGDNSSGQTNVPAGLTNVAAIAAAGLHSLALKNDGTVVSWGTYFNGLTNVPIAVPFSVANVTAIASGRGQVMALTTNRTVVAWGFCYNGATWAPVVVPGGLTNVVAITAGSCHNLALTSDSLLLGPPPSVISLGSGGSTNLNISVWSRTPFACQWSFNNSNIVGATATTLVITNFSPANAGLYSLAVSNQDGLATASSVLRLSNSPVVLVDGLLVGDTITRTNTAQITISNGFGADAPLYYTLDGSNPDFTAFQYLSPFALTNRAIIRAIGYNAAYTQWAEAPPVNVEVVPIYPLAATTPGGGSISISPAPFSGTNLYVGSALVTLTATPSNGWSFIGWMGDTNTTSSLITLSLDGPRSAQAIFGTPLSLFTNGNGEVTAYPSNALYPYGSNVQLVARPAANSYFLGWANSATGFANPLSLAVTNPTPGITALFGMLKANQASLTVLSNGGGTVAVSPASTVYTNGDIVRLAALSSSNHVFANWTEDATGDANPLVLTLTGSRTITANFVSGTPSLPVIAMQGPLKRTTRAGVDTTFAAQVVGEGPLSYQWRLNSSPIAGASQPTLALTQLTPAQVGIYDLVVTGAVGTVTSTPASLALFTLEMAFSDTEPLPLLVLDAAPGIGYQIQFLTNLAPNSLTQWSSLVSVSNQGARFYFVDEPDTNCWQRFYRVVPQ